MQRPIDLLRKIHNERVKQLREEKQRDEVLKEVPNDEPEVVEELDFDPTPAPKKPWFEDT